MNAMEMWVTILTSVTTLVTTIVAVTTLTGMQIRSLRNEMNTRFDAVNQRLDSQESDLTLIKAHLLGVSANAAQA